MINKELLQKYALIELARRGNFYAFCRLRVPTFFRDDRYYLRDICEKIEDWMKDANPRAKLILNAPPQTGKSLITTLAKEYILAFDTQARIITTSYNELLSTNFGKKVRDDIAEEKADSDIIVYSDIFPNVKIKRGSSSAKKWSIYGAQQTSMLATSPKGTVTGFASTYCFIDDVIKDAEQAYNDNIMDQHWEWYKSTLESRILGKLLITFTRWRTNDLCGRLMDFYDENKIEYTHISISAENEKGESFCEAYLNKEAFKEKKLTISQEIWNANYCQAPIDIKGRLYTKYETYNFEELQKQIRKENKTIDSYFERIMAYIDTADTGQDYLCCIVFGIKNGNIYILDVLYTQSAMEITEPETAEMLNRWNVSECVIESNNGGRGFARNVMRILEELNNYTCHITTFTQKKNKISRILTYSSNIMQRVYFQEGWGLKYKAFFAAITKYQRAVKNAHDDAPDALTGCYEISENLGYII